jgi:hypothetical protein
MRQYKKDQEIFLWYSRLKKKLKPPYTRQIYEIPLSRKPMVGIAKDRSFYPQ